jgi:flagellar basal body-associated protein FliL
MRRRKRAVIAVLLPVVIFLWIVGWSLYWMSLQKTREKAEPARSKDSVSIKAIVLEDPQEIAS